MPKHRHDPDRVLPSSEAPVSARTSAAPAMKPRNPPSPYDDAPAFSTRKRSRASSGATSAAPSGDEASTPVATNTGKAKTPRRKSEGEAKAPRRKSTKEPKAPRLKKNGEPWGVRRKGTPKDKSTTATPAKSLAPNHGATGNTGPVGGSQEGQKKKARPAKKAKTVLPDEAYD